MAAAEYYSNAPMGPTHHTNLYQQPQHAQTMSSLPPPHNSSSAYQSQHPPPPPYEAIQQEHRPTVHFADSSLRPHRDSFSSQAPIPVLVEQQHQYSNPPSNYGSPQRPDQQTPPYSPSPQQVKPQSHQSPQLQPVKPHSNYGPQYGSAKPQSHNGGPSDGRHQNDSRTASPSRAGILKQPHNPQYLSPYMQPNPPQHQHGGYASDPEYHRRHRRHSNESRERRRHRHHSRDSRDETSHRQRSRSTNTDGFLGAAGGGLIGDLIFPGLGTVGGVVAGWIGGKDYGKHRKKREDRLDRNQEKWEHKFGRDR